jgi:hypothetical protein
MDCTAALCALRQLFAICIAIVLAACSTSSPKSAEHSLDQPSSGLATIYVVRRDWHIDVGFAVSDLAPPLSSLAAAFPDARYLVFGFGDRRYLKSRDKRLPNMIAALWPGRGLILVTALTAPPQQAFGEREVITLPVHLEQAIAAEAWVWAGLSKEQAVVQQEGPGPYPGSLYIDSDASYSALHTCNTWAAEALKAAGFDVHTHLVLFAGQTWNQARRINTRAAAPSAALEGIPAPGSLDLNRRAADRRFGTRPWSSSSAEPPPSSSAEEAGSSC